MLEQGVWAEKSVTNICDCFQNTVHSECSRLFTTSMLRSGLHHPNLWMI
jgi:hypothetical protein